MNSKAVYVLLFGFFLMILSIYILTGDNKIHVQFVHLLQPSSSGSAAAQQSQPSRNQTLPSSSSTSPSSSSATSSSSLLLPE